MDISQSARSAELAGRLAGFMAQHIYPNERRFYQEAERLGLWEVYPVVEKLKLLAWARGFGTRFCRAHAHGLTNLERAPLCESMGRSHLAPERGSSAAIGRRLDMPRSQFSVNFYIDCSVTLNVEPSSAG